MFRQSFGYGKKFNLDLSSWNTSKVTNMGYMFTLAGCGATTWSIGDISNWDTSNVKSMDYLFKGASYNAANFKLDLSGWNTSNVTNMYQMFYKCQTLKTIYVSDLWDTSKVTSSTDMFRGCTSLVGGNGTAYSSSYTNKTYARIDKSGTSGYLTGKTYKLKTGLEFNALIPETTTAVVFTDETKPSSASSIAVGVDDSVVG